MAELVDAPDLGSGGLKPVGVQVPLLVLVSISGRADSGAKGLVTGEKKL